MRKYELNSMSKAICHSLNEYFSGIDEQKIAVERLNKVIQQKENTINNLEYELRHKTSGVFNENKPL